jgi:DNA polymerase-3 subunit delta
MKLRPDQLEQNLQSNLSPIYIVSGDEPFQLGEACQTIREQCKAQGVTEREVMHVDRSFDWYQLTDSANAMSLFAERKLIEIRMPTGKPGDAGAKVLLAYAQNPSPDNVLLLVTGKLDGRAKWFKALEGAGVYVQIWPIEPARLPQWISMRLRQRGLMASSEAVKLLADRVEGNLLAADQEMEKLLLLNGPGQIDVQQVIEAVADSARYDAFGLMDAALAGDAPRVSKILFGLRGEGLEPIALMGAMNYQLRAMCAMAADVQQGEPLDAVLASHRVWDKRKPLVRGALQRHNLKRWQGFIWKSGEIDRMIKGLAQGTVWDELLQLALRIAGVAVVKNRPAA